MELVGRLTAAAAAPGAGAAAQRRGVANWACHRLNTPPACLRNRIRRCAQLRATASVQMTELVTAKGKTSKTAVTKLKVAELREVCAQAGLDSTGKKQELVNRVFAHLSANGADPDLQAVPPPAPSPSMAPEIPDEPAAGSEGGGMPSDRQHQLMSWLAEADQEHEAEGQVEEAHEMFGSEAHEPRMAGHWYDDDEMEVLQFGSAAKRGRRLWQGATTGCAVTWLGTSSGSPTHDRNVSCVAVELGDGTVALVDCGEGTKRQIARSHLDVLQVRQIFITHHHGDHIFGLPGVIAAMSAAVKPATGPGESTPPLSIYGPPGLMEYVHTSLKLLGISLNMRVLVTEWHKTRNREAKPMPVDDVCNLWYAGAVPSRGATQRASQTIEAAKAAGGEVAKWEEDRRSVGIITGLLWSVSPPGGFRVAAAQLFHRVPTFGYCFLEPRRLVDITPEMANRHMLSGNTQDFEASIPGRKLLVLGDTCDSTSIAHVAHGADMVSHEATFSDGMERKAEIACHSTSRMAGEFAASICAEKLFLTHFSPRYQEVGDAPEGLPGDDITMDDVQTIVHQAREGFGRPEVYAVKDFATYHVPEREPQFRVRDATASAAESRERRGSRP
mmetsp:Transcript_7520/g.19056  ORF Transcript_7520/g.19056 Transcript_7520/m.19056 type:complete len:614 (+) Transcript_7520:134-1975(+)